MVEVSGAHRLGPHVVGRRVVVRRFLRGETGPSGGPAMTDVLGVCTSWDPGATCTVEPESGPPVVITLADIVSGKPVPPRPATRLRVSPAEAQSRATALFPGAQHRMLGTWTLRWSDAHPARRANSVLAMTPSGLSGPPASEQAAVAQVAAAYVELGRRPIAAVLRETPEEAAFLGAGWVPQGDAGDTVFQVVGVAAARRTPTSRRLDERVSLEDGPAGVATARIGTAVAGVAAVQRDWVGLRGIEVPPSLRGQGLGRAVTAALIEWGAEQGASTAYLQVPGENTAALATYAGFGFVEHHSYRYLALPG